MIFLLSQTSKSSKFVRLGMPKKDEHYAHPFFELDNALSLDITLACYLGYTIKIKQIIQPVI